MSIPISDLLTAFSVDIPCQELHDRLVQIKRVLLQQNCSPEILGEIEEVTELCRLGKIHIHQYIFAVALLVDQKNERDNEIARKAIGKLLPILVLDSCSQADRQCADRKSGGVPYRIEVMEARLMLGKCECHSHVDSQDFESLCLTEEALATLQHVANYFERETLPAARVEGRFLIQRHIDDVRIVLRLVKALW